MLKIAEKYFGFTEKELEGYKAIKSLIKDGYEHVMSETNLNQNDLLIMDINYEEGSDSKISPPIKFLSK
jgi:hypothetical protein